MKRLQHSQPHTYSLVSLVSFALFSSITMVLMLFVGMNCSLPAPLSREKGQEKREPIDQQTEGLKKQIERATKGGIAAYCSNDDMCKQDLHCELHIPKGYCTKSCLRSTECPPKSACVRIRFSNGTTFLRCLQTCRKTEDCRSSFYCYHPPKAWKQICLPQTNKP